jgi:hypothetical protein
MPNGMLFVVELVELVFGLLSIVRLVVKLVVVPTCFFEIGNVVRLVGTPVVAMLVQLVVLPILLVLVLAFVLGPMLVLEVVPM